MVKNVARGLVRQFRISESSLYRCLKLLNCKNVPGNVNHCLCQMPCFVFMDSKMNLEPNFWAH